MSRRANGEGTIYQLTNGSWRGIVSVRVNGVLHRKSIVRKKRASVVALLEDIKRKLSGVGTSIDQQGTLGEFLTAWVSTAVKNEMRENTYRSYERAIRLHINPRIGAVKLAKLTPLHIEKFKQDVVAENVGSRARQVAFQVLMCGLDYAVHPMRLIASNPCANVKPPKHATKTMKPFEAEEAKRIIDDAAGTRWAAFYSVAFGCGLRAGELFGLKWSDIDWTAATVSIQRQALDHSGIITLAVPKTKHSIRTINVPKVVMSALREHRSIQFRQGLASDDQLVFPNLKGGPMCRANFYTDEWKLRLVRCCLEHRGVHNTRHTFATLALLAGVPVAVVSKCLGHSSPAITMQVYAHCLPSAEKGAAVAMDRLLG